jgi:hypothetical protein
LKSSETWQELLDETQSALGMPTALLDSKDIILQANEERNKLCREIRSRKKALPIICAQSQQFIAEMAGTNKTAVVEICEAGIAKLVVLVFRDQNYLGSITTCGCMLPDTAIEKYLIEKTTGIGGYAIAEMAEKVPTVPKEHLQQLAEDLFRNLNAS